MQINRVIRRKSYRIQSHQGFPNQVIKTTPNSVSMLRIFREETAVNEFMQSCVEQNLATAPQWAAQLPQ
jgi:hypothetical protein